MSEMYFQGLGNLCDSTSSVNPRDHLDIQKALGSHDWEVMSADKSPWGIISRFACKKCGDEYVAMLTSPRGLKAQETSGSKLEVSAGNVVWK
jgi:hypothetical protein